MKKLMRKKVMFALGFGALPLPSNVWADDATNATSFSARALSQIEVIEFLPHPFTILILVVLSFVASVVIAVVSLSRVKSLERQVEDDDMWHFYRANRYRSIGIMCVIVALVVAIGAWVGFPVKEYEIAELIDEAKEHIESGAYVDARASLDAAVKLAFENQIYFEQGSWRHLADAAVLVQFARGADAQERGDFDALLELTANAWYIHPHLRSREADELVEARKVQAQIDWAHDKRAKGEHARAVEGFIEAGAVAEAVKSLVQVKDWERACELGSVKIEPSLAARACSEEGQWSKAAQCALVSDQHVYFKMAIDKLLEEQAWEALCDLGASVPNRSDLVNACVRADEIEHLTSLLEELDDSSLIPVYFEERLQAKDNEIVCDLGSENLEPLATAMACEEVGDYRRAMALYNSVKARSKARALVKRLAKQKMDDLVCELANPDDGYPNVSTLLSARSCEKSDYIRSAVVLFGMAGARREVKRIIDELMEHEQYALVCELGTKGVHSRDTGKACERRGLLQEAGRIYIEVRRFDLAGPVYEKLADRFGSVTDRLEAARAYSKAGDREAAVLQYSEALPVIDRHKAVEQLLEAYRGMGKIEKGMEVVISWIDDAERDSEHFTMSWYAGRVARTLLFDLDLKRSERIRIQPYMENLSRRLESLGSQLDKYPKCDVEGMNKSSGYDKDNMNFEATIIEGTIKNTTEQDIASVDIVIELFEPDPAFDRRHISSHEILDGRSKNEDLGVRAGYVESMAFGPIEAGQSMKFSRELRNTVAYRSFNYRLKGLIVAD